MAPLSSSFMLVSMLGFMFTVIYSAHGKINETWGFALGLVFAIMFVASIISMTHAPIEAELYLDRPRNVQVHKRKKSTKK